jgi:hypothetical protein
MKVDKVLKCLVLLITAVMLVVKLCGWADIGWLKVFSVAIVYAVFYVLGALYLLWYNSPKVVEKRKKAEKETMDECVKNSLKSAHERIKLMQQEQENKE